MTLRGNGAKWSSRVDKEQDCLHAASKPVRFAATEADFDGIESVVEIL